MSERFYIPTSYAYSHHISFVAKKGQDALRVLLVTSNAKMALFESKSLGLVAQSKSVEDGDAQLLSAHNLRHDEHYTILLEFSEEAGVLDGEAAQQCNHFVMALKTWDSKQICTDSQETEAR